LPSPKPTKQCSRRASLSHQAYCAGQFSGAELSYGAVATAVEALRERYRAGFGHSHRIGLLLENRPDFLIHWLALNGIGASIMPINPAYRASEIEKPAPGQSLDPDR
jgi:acyl-CoA synthetase (AMP-forming)/AMP-acid ligase II